jgi:hypothetical protein
LKYFYNIALLVLLSYTVSAQDVDSLKVKPSFIPTGVRVGTDVIAIIKSSYDNTFKGWEAHADIDFHRYYFTLDYGYGARTFITESSSYANNGNYWRIGADVNFLKKDPDRNMFFVGLRYGASTFSEDLSVVKNDPVWGSLNGDFSNTNVNAHWFELTTGLRVKIWKVIWLGYTARLKFALKTGATPDMLPYDVPGYGRADEESYWGFNYQIFVRLPVRKSTSIPLKK